MYKATRAKHSARSTDTDAAYLGATTLSLPAVRDHATDAMPRPMCCCDTRSLQNAACQRHSHGLVSCWPDRPRLSSSDCSKSDLLLPLGLVGWESEPSRPPTCYRGPGAQCVRYSGGPNYKQFAHQAAPDAAGAARPLGFNLGGHHGSFAKWPRGAGSFLYAFPAPRAGGVMAGAGSWQSTEVQNRASPAPTGHSCP